jgi:antitoxin component YwqK of YwqJK toxin-antitoxin module
MEGNFKGGQLWDGRHYIYDEDGLLLKVEVYKNGVYHSDGQL